MQNPQFYDERAQPTASSRVPILAPRGRILDRDGRVIVDNHSSFSLILARESLKDEHLRPIAQGLDLDYSDLVRARAAHPSAAQIRADRDQGGADAGRPVVRRFAPRFLPGAGADPGAAAALSAERHAGARDRVHGEISEQELDAPEFAKYDPGDVVGKFGIEKQYNDCSRAWTGSARWWWIIAGRCGRCSRTSRRSPGKDLQAHHRSGPAGGGGTGDGCRLKELDGSQERRGGGARSAHRRSAGHGQPADLRPQQVRGAHQDQGLAARSPTIPTIRC